MGNELLTRGRPLDRHVNQALRVFIEVSDIRVITSTHVLNFTLEWCVNDAMPIPRISHRIPFLFLLIAAWGSMAHAQMPQKVAETDALYQTIASLDSALFHAVNTCDLKALDGFWADDAEFYHDKADPTIGRKNITQAIQNNLCGKVTRELVPGTLEVHSLKGYGAVELGIHRFYHPWTQDHGIVGEARFIHLWQYKDGAWRITRVISYEHQLAKESK